MRDGWHFQTLGEVSEVIMGRQLSPSKKIGTRPRPYIRAANIGSWGISLNDIFEMDFTEEEEARFASQIGDTLLVEGGNEKSVGCPGFVTEREAGLCIQNTVVRCRVKNPKIFLPEFQYQMLRYMYWRRDFAQLCAGTTIMHLGQKRAELVPILLPPLPEQKRIVDLISSVDSYIEALQQQLESAKKSRNAVLHQLLTAGGDDWVESSLGVQMSLEYGKPLTESNRDGIGFPVYGSAGIVGMHSEPLVSTAPVIIVGRKGTAGAVYWSEVQCFVIDTAYFVASKTDIELKFLYHLLNFVDLKSVTAQTGVPGLNRDRAYSLKCKIPPKSKQFEIVEMISTMDEVVNKTESILAETQNLRSGLLSDLLSGEHEIPASYDKVIGTA
jgi:type I restriction enzyme S subunit